jgi:simple sugar transport system ATP-binding protein
VRAARRTPVDAAVIDAGERAEPLVELRAITKLYGAVTALKRVDFEVRPGEVVGLVGDNGAGKSTLMKILAGALEPSAGEILIRGVPTRLVSTRSAIALGIHMVFQDLALCGDLDVAANFFIAREPTRFGIIRGRRMHALAHERLEELGISLRSTALPVRLLSGGQRQCVAIARALSLSPELLILDEPTAALGVSQSKLVLDLIRGASDRGTSVVLISHRLRDVLDVCSRIVVLYEGSNVADLSPDISLEEIVRYIVTDPEAGARAGNA